jgi:hypothetical protein
MYVLYNELCNHLYPGMRLYSRKTWCMETNAGVDYNSPCLIVNSAVSYPPPIQREKGGARKISPIGLALLYLSANFQNNQ